MVTSIFDINKSTSWVHEQLKKFDCGEKAEVGGWRGGELQLDY